MVSVLLVGLGITTLSALESLLSRCNVKAIVRNAEIGSDANNLIVNLANKAGIPIYSDVSQQNIKSLLLKFNPDCVVVSSYNQIFPPELTALSTFINVHYSPLPYYRGRANVNWAIINNESCAAITIHQITPELDAGNILFQQLIPLQSNHNVADIYDKLNEIQRQYLAETVIKACHGYQGVPQNDAEATYCCTRLPEDGEINWSASTKDIDCLIRALTSPFPGAYTYFQGKKLLIWSAKPVKVPPTYVGRIPGRILSRAKTEGYVDVLTSDGIIRLFQVQFEGEEKTAAANIIQSVKSTLGLRLSDLLHRIQTLEQENLRLKANAK